MSVEPVDVIENEYIYTIVADSVEMCEMCMCLTQDTLVIMHDPTDPSSTMNNIRNTVIFVALCELPEDIIECAKSHAKQVRLLTTDGDLASPDVEYFTLAKFREYVPLRNDMFSQYICEKFLSYYYSDYVPTMFQITKESADALMDGISASNETFSEAMRQMTDCGYKCFEKEADYTSVGKLYVKLSAKILSKTIPARFTPSDKSIILYSGLLPVFDIDFYKEHYVGITLINDVHVDFQTYAGSEIHVHVAHNCELITSGDICTFRIPLEQFNTLFAR